MSFHMRVPRADRPVFAWLGKAPQTVFDEILAAWAEPKFATRARLLQVIEQVPLTGVEGEQLVDAILGLAVFRFSHSGDAAELAETVASSSDVDLQDEEETARLTKRIEQALVLPPIVLAAKAIDLRADHDALFHTCRVYSDVRPVFDDDPTLEPYGAVAFHMLKIEYFKNGSFESMYLTLTDEDLEVLDTQVARALVKKNTLHRYLNRLELPVVDPEGT